MVEASGFFSFSNASVAVEECDGAEELSLLVETRLRVRVDQKEQERQYRDRWLLWSLLVLTSVTFSVSAHVSLRFCLA